MNRKLRHAEGGSAMIALALSIIIIIAVYVVLNNLGGKFSSKGDDIGTGLSQQVDFSPTF